MAKPVISIIDYGVGNLNSVANMIRRAGAEANFVKNAEEVSNASRLVLPGVGAFDHCRKSLNRVIDLESVILESVKREVPLLGICVGMQLLGSSSEEGSCPGLDIISGRVKKLNFMDASSFELQRVPHMGWRQVQPKGKARLFLGDLSVLNRFYFVHSYYFECIDRENVAGTAHYGFDFDAAIEKGRVFGTQFHPEKSHRYGLELFKNFADLLV